MSQGSSVSIVDPVARLPGSEPGVDVRRESAKRAYAHLKEDSEIEVVDYDADHVKFQQFHNESFLQFLETVERKPPMKVRWINVAVCNHPELLLILMLMVLLGSFLGCHQCTRFEVSTASTGRGGCSP